MPVDINYDNSARFASYYYQIKEVLSFNPSTVLEIGIGNNVVSSYLERCKIDVTTMDIDVSKEPDIVGDIRNLQKHLKEKYDVILCAEILEHIPFDDFKKIISILPKYINKGAVITIPQAGLRFTIIFDFPLFHFKTLCVRLPIFYKKAKEHYWEINYRKSYSLKSIRKIMKDVFLIEKEYSIPANPYHRMFVLYKKSENLPLRERTSFLQNQIHSNRYYPNHSHQENYE